MKPSLLSKTKDCLICHSNNTDLHHVRLGNISRERCEDYGLYCYLCRYHHELLHNCGRFKKEVQIMAQNKLIEEIGEERYMDEIGKKYI